MIVLITAMTCPVAFYGLGAWLETVGTIDDWTDEFWSRWPLAMAGSVLGAWVALHV